MGVGFFADGKKRFDDFIQQADDGPYYVHVLRTGESEVHRIQTDNLNKRPEDQTPLADYAHMQSMIQKRLDEAAYEPGHFEKVQWFAKYWTRCIPYGAPTFTSITGPGMYAPKWQTNAPPD